MNANCQVRRLYAENFTNLIGGHAIHLTQDKGTTQMGGQLFAAMLEYLPKLSLDKGGLWRSSPVFSSIMSP